MAKKKTPVVVTIKKSRHATQPFTFVIDDPGPGPKVTVKERYVSYSSAKRGALRKLRAVSHLGNTFKGAFRSLVWFTHGGREIKFV